MNWVDLVIVGATGLAFYNGFRRGAVMQVFSWGGFIAGIFAGGMLAPFVVHLFKPSAGAPRAIASLVSFLGTAFTVEALVAFAGARVVHKITNENARKVNAIAGSVVAGTLALLVAWMLSAPATRVPDLAASVKRSTILRAAHDILPTPPDFLAAIGSLLSRTGFPEVFAQFNPSLAPSVDPPPRSLAREKQVLAAARLTYKIQGRGCGGQVNGSGFPVGSDMVVTAAHVVAGTEGTRVIEAADAGGHSFDGAVVYIDPDTDIAVLHVPGLDQQRLRVAGSAATRNTDGAAIGYPGGQQRRISVARVRGRTDALGRDIYSRRQVTRNIYILRARVIQGNSGGPFVDTDGRVRGMVFAASATEREEAYALTEVEVQRAMDEAEGRARAVSTGRCAI